MKVYLSSTYTDLKRHRAVVARALSKAGYDAVLMENYVARNARVEFACRGDVSGCDVYLGVFAWRHGHIPEDDNPQRFSVTEMELDAASSGPRPLTQFTFLLDDKARWPSERKDVDLTRITALRHRLKKRCSAYFSSAEGLALEVLAALRVHENTRMVQQLQAIDVMLEAQALGSSHMLNIQDQLTALGDTTFVELQIAPIPWWHTRLHLVAALAEAYGKVQGLVFVDGKGRFLLMASPKEVRRRLAQRWPFLEQAYADLRLEAPTLDALGATLWRYPQLVSQVMGVDESAEPYVVTDGDLKDALGLNRNAEVVDVSGKEPSFLLREFLGRQTPWVAQVRDGRLEGLVDRELLKERVVQAALA